MYNVMLPEDMRRLDAYMMEKKKICGLLLMENAAFGVSSLVMESRGASSRVFAVCGVGNNGGDGFAAARQLAAQGYRACALLLGRSGDLKGNALSNARYFMEEGLLAEASREEDVRAFFNAVAAGDVVIDAIFGTGLSRETDGVHRTAIQSINECGAFVVSVDIPSGIGAQTGQVLGAAVRADATVTFQYPKPGHFIYPGREHTGALRVRRIGCDGGFDIRARYDWRAYPSDTQAIRLPRRKRNTHKGSYGTLAILAGGRGYTGAGLLCIEAALKSGVGLVAAGIPRSLLDAYCKRVREAVTFPIADCGGRFCAQSIADADQFVEGKDALAAGPGLTQNDDMLPFIRRIVCDYDVKKVLDADALNLIAKQPQMLEKTKGRIVLTPHPREFSRLSGLPVAQVLADPVKAASGFSGRYGVTVLLKGATTLVATGDRVSFVLAGSPGMAKGGSGDVLTGVIGSLLAQGFEPHEAAFTGAHLCGLAGEAAARESGEYAMTPADTIRRLKDAVRAISQ